MATRIKYVRPGVLTNRISSVTNLPLDVYVKITYDLDSDRLSFIGVEGPRQNGDCVGSCGQIQINPEDITPADGWTKDMINTFCLIWDYWHLNDMRAGCSHQRVRWNLKEKIEVVEYGLTTEAYYLRKKARKLATDLAVRREILPEQSPTIEALIRLDDWFKPRYEPPDADDPLSGCYEVKKRETKLACWAYPNEHPKGLLMKPCEICGHKYGSSWLHEKVPTGVLSWLFVDLPDADPPIASAWEG